MATKPTDQPEYWATDAVYTTGPFIGQPQKSVPPGAFAAEGHRPGSLFPTPAEYENSQQNRITGLVRWLFLGSSAGAADAHVLETDAAGGTAVTSLTVNDGVDEVAVDITGVGTATPALLVTNTANGGAINGTIGNGTGVAVAAQVGSGAGTGVLVTLTGTPAGGEGILVTTSGVTAAPAIAVDHNSTGVGIDVDVSGGSGRGVQINGNATADAALVAVGGAQYAIFATSSSNVTAAVGGLGVGTTIGGDFIGGSGSSAATGLRGTATHADANGLHGRTSASASLTAAGVYGEGRGTGTFGVYGNSPAGIGVVAQGDSSSPVYPALQLVTQNADPSGTPGGGEVISHSGMKQLRHATSGEGYFGVYQAPAVGCSANMLCIASSAVYANNSGVSWTTTIQPELVASAGNGYFGQIPGGELTFTIVMDCRLTVATANYIEVQVIDLSNGNAVIFTRNGTGGTLAAGYYMGIATTEWQRSLAISFQYSPPSEGDLLFEIQIRKGGGGAGTNVEARDIGCQIWGTITP